MATYTIRPNVKHLSRMAAVAAALSIIFAFCVAVGAARANADEIKKFNPAYTNGKCSHQQEASDSDCYHYVKTYAKHSGCYYGDAHVIGANPKTNAGKEAIYQSYYYCPAVQPSGNYQLYVFVSSPHCKAGLAYRDCPKP